MRSTSRLWFVTLLAAAALVLAGCSGAADDTPPPRTAVLIDQLALTSPNPEFVANATRTLETAGYAVDYVPTEQVTVDFYRALPSRGYGLILLRGHSGYALSDASQAAEEVRGKGQTFLFTSEPYSEAYPEDQSKRRLSVAFYFDTASGEQDPDALLDAFRDLPRYFGVKPGFIESSAEGRFPNSTVVLMGCNGLSSEALAKAFVKKGARAVIGWDELVSAQHTDVATERLLARLLDGNASIEDAVAQTAADSGPDPTYGGKLVLYD